MVKSKIDIELMRIDDPLQISPTKSITCNENWVDVKIFKVLAVVSC